MNQRKTIIILGASGGIGRVLSKKFVEAGINVTLSARNEDKLLSLRKDLEVEQVLVVPGDGSKREDVERVFELTRNKFGKVDAIVITAGTWKKLSINEETDSALELMNSHYQALYLPSFVTSFVAQKFFREQGSGLMVNISSHAALKPELEGNLTYGPMKAASRHLMLALRSELVGTNVRVTDLAPAIVNTLDAAVFLDTEDKKAMAVQPEEIAEWIIENLDNPEIPATKLFESELVV